MTVLKKISSGDFGKIALTGKNRNADIGLLIDVPFGSIVSIDELEIDNTFVPIIKRGGGEFFFNKIKTSEFGGDGFNIHSSNVLGDTFIAADNTPTRPYTSLKMWQSEGVEECLERHEITVYDPLLLKPKKYKKGYIIEGYHQDGIQAYALNDCEHVSHSSNILENIDIKNIDISMSGSKAQGIALTESCKYSDIFLGEESLKIDVAYYYSIIATNLSNSCIGGAEVQLNKPIRIQRPAAKKCPHQTYSVDLVNLDGEHYFDSDARNINFIGGSGGKHDDSFLFSRREMQAISELIQINC